MLLYRGTETNHQDYIDFHNDSITMFTYPQYIFRGELGVLDFFDPYYVQSAQITGIISNHQDHVYLTDSEIADLIELFRNIEIIKPEGDAWMQNRNAYYDISVSDIYNYDHNFRIQYPYIIINGTGYSAQESGLSALYDFASYVFSNYQNISQNTAKVQHIILTFSPDVHFLSYLRLFRKPPSSHIIDFYRKFLP